MHEIRQATGGLQLCHHSLSLPPGGNMHGREQEEGAACCGSQPLLPPEARRLLGSGITAGIRPAHAWPYPVVVPRRLLLAPPPLSISPSTTHSLK